VGWFSQVEEVEKFESHKDANLVAGCQLTVIG
jgi:hypothetical protein